MRSIQTLVFSAASCIAVTSAADVFAQTGPAARPTADATPAAELDTVGSIADEGVLVIERATDRAGRDRVAQLLRASPFRLQAEALPLGRLKRILTASTGDKVNFAVVTATPTDELPTVTIDLPPTTVWSGLSAIAATTGMRFVYRDGLVIIKPADEVREVRDLVVYNVRAAVAMIRDKPGPRLALRAPGEEEPFLEEPEPKPISGFTIDRIEQLVTEHVDPDSWEVEGTTIRAWNGVLFIRQTPANHRRIRAFLATLGVMPAPVQVRPRRVPVLRARPEAGSGSGAGAGAKPAPAGESGEARRG